MRNNTITVRFRSYPISRVFSHISGSRILAVLLAESNPFTHKPVWYMEYAPLLILSIGCILVGNILGSVIGSCLFSKDFSKEKEKDKAEKKKMADKKMADNQLEQ